MRAFLVAGPAVLVLLLSACGAPTSRSPRSSDAVEESLPTSVAIATATTAVGGAGPPSPRRRDSGPGGGLASPIRVPIGGPDVEGWALPEVEGEIRAAIAEGCGGDQCVGIVRVNDDDPDNDNPLDCDLIQELRGDQTADDGSLFVELPRGGDLVLEVNIRCEDVRETGGNGTDGEDGTDGTGEDGTDGAPGEGGDGEPSATDLPQLGTGSG
jgi:hypothetical protein